MKVSIRFFTILREVTNKKEETLEYKEGTQVTLKKILEKLSQKYGKKFDEYVFEGKDFKIKGHLQFLVNGKNVQTVNGIDTIIEDNSVIAILPPVGGG